MAKPSPEPTVSPGMAVAGQPHSARTAYPGVLGRGSRVRTVDLGPDPTVHLMSGAWAPCKRLASVGDGHACPKVLCQGLRKGTHSAF